jgi:hypothetical protein
LVNDGSCYGGALAFAARYPTREELSAVGKANPFEQMQSTTATLGPRKFHGDQRRFDILAQGHCRHEMMELEYESHRIRAKSMRWYEACQIVSFDEDTTARRSIEQTDETKQSALAATGRTHERDQLARIHRQRSAAQSLYQAAFVVFGQILYLKKLHGSSFMAQCFDG